MSAMMIEKLAINVNGCEKYATGLTKTTTIDDIKFAMLTATTQQQTTQPICLEDFGVFEKWQGNERLLDGRVRIHKLVRVWQSLPGDQLSQVQFLIKRKRPQMTLAARQHQQQQQHQNKQAASFALCTLSPSMQKTWNYEKMSRKSSYVNRQLRLVASGETQEATTTDESSSCDESTAQVDSTRRRYASIKRYHRSKRSSIKKCGGQMKSAYVDLVGKQTEIIERQMAELEESNETSQHQTERLFDDYLNVEMCLEAKLAKIEKLTTELNTLVKPDVKLAKTNRRLAASIELDRKQADKLKSMDTALERIDDMISLKQKSVETLENELKRLEELSLTAEADEMIMTGAGPRRFAKSSSASSSNQSSTSSLFTSISSISSQSSVRNYQMEMNASGNTAASGNKSCQSYGGCDNESDTGISSANSEDFSTQQLETLV